MAGWVMEGRIQHREHVVMRRQPQQQIARARPVSIEVARDHDEVVMVGNPGGGGEHGVELRLIAPRWRVRT